MPIYEYICKKCGEKFDALRSMSDADQSINCTQCHSSQTRRVLSTCFTHSSGSESSSGHSGARCGNCSSGSCSSCSH